VLYDYGVFDEFAQALSVCNLDLIEIAERNHYELTAVLYDALAPTDRTVKSKINTSDVISKVVFSETIEMPVHEKKQDHKTYLEKILDFSLFDLPNLGTGPKAPVFLVGDD